MFKLLAITTILISSSVLANDIGYSGRLVKVDGSPVTGTPNLKFEITYSGSPSTIECTETINSVPLNNGVFNVKLNFDATTTCVFNDVLNATPSGQTVRIRVTDETNSNTYDYQSISNVPLAYKAEVSKLAEAVKDGSIVASSLDQMSATTGQVLKWNGTAWAPAVDGGASGTITNITAGLGVLKSGIATSPTLALDVSSTFFDFAGNSLNLKDNSVTPVKIPFNAQHFDAANLVQLNLKLNTAGAITSGVTGLGVNVDNTTLEIVGNQLRVKAVPAGNIPDAEGLNTSCADGKVLKASGGSVICGDDTDTDTQLTDTQVDTFVGNEITAGKVPYKNGSELVDSEIHQNAGGNIGIGTTSPTSKLTVSSAGSQLRLNDSANAGVALGVSVQDTGSSNQASFDVLNGGSEHATFRFFRNTNTTGNKSVLFKKGNGSDTTEGQIGVDGSDSFFQIGGGNFGIGTNTPSAKLEVNGQVKITGGAPGAGKILTSDAAGLASWQTPPSGADNLGNHTATGHLKLEGFRLTTDADEDTYISSSSDDQIDFRVGGNNSLRLWQNALDTNSTGSFSLKTNGAGTVTDAAYSFAGDTNTGLFRPSADHLAITTGGSERLRVDSTGNIAVGKTTAAAKLDINGNIRATEICDETGSNCKDISTGWGPSGTVTSVAAGSGLTGGTITTSGTLAVDTGTTANKIVQLNGSAQLPAVDGSQLTNVSGNATAITDGLIVDADINASANIAQSKINGLTTALSNKLETSRVNNGALGTSTTDVPTQNAVKTYVDAEISSASANPAGANTYIQFNNAGSMGASAKLSWDDTNEYLNVGDASGTSALIFRGNSSNGIYSYSSGEMRFLTTGSLNFNNDVHVTSSGNLGVGTSSPKDKLTVLGSFGMKYTSSVEDRLNGFTNGNPIAKVSGLGIQYGGELYKITFSDRGSRFAEAFFYRDQKASGLSEIKKIQEKNNGTYTISAQGNAADNIIEFFISPNPVNAGDSYVRIDMAVANDSNYAGAALAINPGATSISTPNVATDLTTGENKFGGRVVASSFVGDGSQLTGINANSSSNTTDAVITADSDNNNSGDILLNTNTTTKVIVKNNGNVGIGTTNPGHKLEVNGTVKADTFITTGLGPHFYSAEAGKTDYRLTMNTNDADRSEIYNYKNGSSPEVFGDISLGRSSVGGVTVKGSNGNVGVSEVNPLAKLHVRKATVPNKHVGNYATSVIEDTEARLQLISADVGTNASTLLLTNSPASGNNKHWGVHHGGPGRSNRFDIGYGTSAASTDTTNILDPKMTILTDGKVGVGKINPVAKLDVAGSIASTSGLYNPTSGNDGMVGLYGDSLNTTQTSNVTAWGRSHASWSGDVHVTSNSDSTSSGAIRFFDYNGTTWDQNMTILPTGYVGIGTATPLGPLEIRHGAGAGVDDDDDGLVLSNYQPSLYFKDLTAGDPDDVRIRGQQSDILFERSADFFTSSPTFTTNMVIKGTGNVGIGTSSPAAKLDVSGDIRANQICDETGNNCKDISNGWGGSSANTSTISFSYRYWTHNSTDSGHYWYAAGSNFRNCKVVEYFQTTDTVQNTSVYQILSHVLGSDRTLWDNHAEHAKFLRDFNQTYAVNSPVYGSWAKPKYGPSSLQKCQVDAGTGVGTEEIQVGDILTKNANPASNLTSSAEGDLAFDSTDKKLQVYHSGSWEDVGKFSKGTTAGDIVYNGGQVGIGTANPNTTLEVHGGPTLSGGWNRVARFQASHPAIQLKGTAQEGKSAWIEYDDATATAGLTLRVNGTGDDIPSATRALKISNNGNVGIGTTAPTEKLQVNGNLSITGDLKMSGSDSYIWTNGTGSGYTGFWDQANSKVLLYMTETTGNIGVGTTSPAEKFHILGDMEMEGDTYGGIYGATRGIWRFDRANPDFGIFYTEGSPDKMQFATQGGGTTNPDMTLAGGNVGIGVTSPTHRLHVNGVARSTQTSFATSSDRRVKEDIEEVRDGLEKVMALRPVRYNYVEEFTETQPALKGRKTGFIAQEVAVVDPSMVNYVEEKVGDDVISDFHILSTDNMVPLLVGATQEQERSIASLKDEVKDLKEENKKLKERLLKIEKALGL